MNFKLRDFFFANSFLNIYFGMLNLFNSSGDEFKYIFEWQVLHLGRPANIEQF